MTPTRFERTPKNIGISVDSENGAAKSGAFSTENPKIDPDLAKIIEAWRMLPEHIRAAILALVETAK